VATELLFLYRLENLLRLLLPRVPNRQYHICLTVPSVATPTLPVAVQHHAPISLHYLQQKPLPERIHVVNSAIAQSYLAMLVQLPPVFRSTLLLAPYIRTTWISRLRLLLFFLDASDPQSAWQQHWFPRQSHPIRSEFYDATRPIE